VSRTPSAGLVGLFALAISAGCPAGESNPEELWLAHDGDELHVKLVETEPAPF
jgi:hypothetical protein